MRILEKKELLKKIFEEEEFFVDYFYNKSEHLSVYYLEQVYRQKIPISFYIAENLPKNNIPLHVWVSSKITLDTKSTPILRPTLSEVEAYTADLESRIRIKNSKAVMLIDHIQNDSAFLKEKVKILSYRETTAQELATLRLEKPLKFVDREILAVARNPHINRPNIIAKIKIKSSTRTVFLTPRLFAEKEYFEVLRDKKRKPNYHRLFLQYVVCKAFKPAALLDYY